MSKIFDLLKKNSEANIKKEKESVQSTAAGIPANMDVKGMRSKILERIKDSKKEGAVIDAAKVITKEAPRTQVLKEVHVQDPKLNRKIEELEKDNRGRIHRKPDALLARGVSSPG